MKKALLIVAMLLLVTPVMATTTITAVQEGEFTADGMKQRTVRIDYSTDVNVRAFALDINIDAGPTFDNIRNFKTGESNAVSKGYGIFPSRFRDFIVVTGPNWVDPNYNPTVAWNEPGSANTGMGWPKMIVEMGTLFAGDANKPAMSGTLFRFDVNSEGGSGTFCITIAANTLRGGVVGNDGNAITASYVGTCVVFAPAGCVVPNIVNMAEAAAIAAVTGAGFPAPNKSGQQYSDTVAAGNVISQDQTAGATIDCGTVINYVLSLGPCTVPNVVGQAEATATANITAAGFTTSKSGDAYSNTVPAGSVISTNPAAGATPGCGTNVTYVKSLGPCVVPNVVNMLPADACTAIVNAGFVATKTYDWSATVAKGRVISSTPAAGATPGCGTTVNFVVSQGPIPVACFDPCGTAFSQQKSQYNIYITNKWDPNSWCEYPTGSGFQCHGDADGKASSPDAYRIYSGDLTLVTNNWKKKIGVYPAGADPRADIDHKASSPDNYRVYTLDLARITSATVGNWKRKGCTSSIGTNLPRNCPLDDASNNTYVKPVNCADTK